MLSFLPPLLRGIIASLILIINTLVLAPLLICVSLLRFVLPIKTVQIRCTIIAIGIAELWISVNSGWMWLTQKMQWDVQGIETLDKQHWYLGTSNHQSWSDIVILQHLLNRKIPMLKFFLKQQLIWVPVIGLCWWALDFPFMKRYTREYLEKHPEKHGEDFKSTQKACEKFKHTPVTVFNFLEGTRFTDEKHQRQQSPYRHLLKPKAGGIGFVIGAMGDSLNSLLDITIVYPNLSRPSFWQFISGQVDHVIVRVEKKAIPSHFHGKNYFDDEPFKEELQNWVSNLWHEKDQQLEQLKNLSNTSV